MEIERKFIIEKTPDNLRGFTSKSIKQGYISSSPVIRIRQLADVFILTIKGKGLIAREEFELSLSKSEFQALSLKTEGLIIDKTRYYIPYNEYMIELDTFHKEYEGLIIAEVEFTSLEEANTFIPPKWFGEDVSENPAYHNVNMAHNIDFEI